MITKPTRGGARKGAGRKTTDGSKGPFVLASLNIREDQRAALRKLGGSAWLRRMIDQYAVTELDVEHISID